MANTHFLADECFLCACVNASFPVSKVLKTCGERTSFSFRECFKHALVVHKLSRFKCVGQAGADNNEHTNCSSRECFRHALAVSAQVFSSQKNSSTRLYQRNKFSHFASGPSMRLLQMHSRFISKIKECACGKYTSLLVSRCCGFALVVIPVCIS